MLPDDATTHDRAATPSTPTPRGPRPRPAARAISEASYGPDFHRTLVDNLSAGVYFVDRDRTIQAAELPLEVTTTEPIQGTFSQKVQAFEKALLANALKDAEGNQRAAAQKLGMTYDQFRHYYRKYELGDLLR